MGNYRVVIKGHKDEIDTESVLNNLAVLFKVESEQIRPLLSSKNFIAKHSLELDLAKKYQQALEQAGCLVDLESDLSFEDPAIGQVNHYEELLHPTNKFRNVPVENEVTIENSTGVKKSVSDKFCSDCGAIINVKAEICPKCGVRQLPSPHSLTAVNPTGKNKLTAALLAFFLGWIGVHKFYLGQTNQGVIYILFCWTMVPGLIAFIECILLLLMSEEEFSKKYPKKF